jgi:ribosomal protein S18 acetylase RimI-like enzyme
MDIIPIDSENSVERQKLIAFLAPHESHALFLLGNLLNPMQPSYLYKCIEGDTITGVCGFYPTFRSCNLFSTSAEASKALAKHVFAHHDPLSILGMASIVKPAYTALLSSGKIAAGSPEYLFFELDLERDFIPHVQSKGIIRSIKEEDLEAVAHLHRYLHGISQDLTIRDDELAQARAYPILFGLEVDGRLVAIAATNGMALTTFQILGVVTDPACRNQGFAKAVCSHLISFMKRQGAKKAVLFTQHDNAGAVKCYQDLGFRITDTYYVAQFQN